jgi:hypothetical protein
VQIDLLIKTPKGSHGKYQKDLAADENQLVRTLCTTALPARLGVHWPGHACPQNASLTAARR